MANPIPCDLCDSPWGHFVLTNQETGDTLGICVGCLPAFAEQLVRGVEQAQTATEPAGVIEPAEAELPDDHPDAPEPNGNGRARKTGAKRRPVPVVAEASETSDD